MSDLSLPRETLRPVLRGVRGEAPAGGPAGLEAGWTPDCVDYAGAEIAALRARLEGPDWEAPARPWNDSGTLELVHVPSGLVFVLVPGGRFRMGDEEGWPDERPVHEVSVRGFLLSKTPCTQRAFDRVGGEDQRKTRGDELPMEGVNWEEATEWCEACGLRLPSEAEWEYACRAGTTGHWFFGDDPASLGEYAWFRENSDRRPHEVGRLLPNPWGLHDLYGNVLEWCEDHWHENYEGAPADGSAWVSDREEDLWHVYRGGSHLLDAARCRSAVRDRNTMRRRFGSLGFRPAASL